MKSRRFRSNPTISTRIIESRIKFSRSMTAVRRALFVNTNAESWVAPASEASHLALDFHQRLQEYAPTRLVNLERVANEIGVGAVYLKDESNRLKLPSFNILGISWAIFRTIAEYLNLSLDTDVITMKRALASQPKQLVSAGYGNHGIAVARMASLLSAPATIYVPATTHHSTIESIRAEGVAVTVTKGSYCEAVRQAKQFSKESGGVFIQNTEYGEHPRIPEWIVEGYDTMMHELDEQLNVEPDLVMAPVGRGSLGQSVVTHYKQPRRRTTIMTVEPDTAARLWKSLSSGKQVSVETGHSICQDLDCDRVSDIAWPFLRSGVDASITVSDYDVHIACKVLQCHGIYVGPCGAAPLAALTRLTPSERKTLGLNRKSVIVLLCTEGSRVYRTPLDVSVEDSVDLTRALVQINSANPSLGSLPGPGETSVAQFIAAWLEYRDIENHWIEPTKGRPSVVGVARGSGGGKSLMLNGHLDTVTLAGYQDDPLSGDIRDGRLYGRGAADMKGGLAAAMVAVSNARRLGLRGDVIFTGVSDEEAESIGTEQVLQAGWRADAAIVTEPTDLAVIHAHRGFVWLEVDVYGVAAHGGYPHLGIDAVLKAGYFLVELDRLAQQLEKSSKPSPAGPPSIHTSVIKGGEEWSTYPARCTIKVERRTVAGETVDLVVNEMKGLLGKIEMEVPDFKFDLRVIFARPSFTIPLDNPFVTFVGDIVKKTLQMQPEIRGKPSWNDSALLFDVGISTVVWGPLGGGIHGKEEWVDINAVRKLAEGLTNIAAEYCG